MDASSAAWAHACGRKAREIHPNADPEQVAKLCSSTFSVPEYQQMWRRGYYGEPFMFLERAK